MDRKAQTRVDVTLVQGAEKNENTNEQCFGFRVAFPIEPATGAARTDTFSL